ncbi:MAG TPA: DnaJ domain-containing protein [Syntrophorhabdales bacterium]|nr:DnaJ domain-containing protein [Syntrophorhabdales bacterium]
MNEKDYYQVLGVEKSTGQQQIKEAYRRLAFQYHPDRNKGEADSVEKMKEINEAYAVLSDPAKRERYDGLRQQYGSYAYDRFRQNYSEQDIYRNSDINQIFEEMARSFGFRSFDEVFRGAYGARPRTMDFRGPGMFGRVIVFGAGNRRRAGAVGQVAEKPSIAARTVSRLIQYALKKIVGSIGSGAGKDVYETITLEEQEAARGGKVVYLDQRRSRELSIAIPAGIREGQLIRLKGMGGGPPGKGDLYLKVEIRRPLFKKVREFLGV